MRLKNKITNKVLIRWHRRLGLLVTFLVALLCFSGVLLQHTESLKLDRIYLTSSWLLNWYNYPEPQVELAQLQHHQVAQVDGQLLLNSKVVASSHGKLWGAAQTDEFILIASGELLYWLTTDGETVDVLPIPAQPSPNALTHTGSQFQLLTSQGWLLADPELSDWAPTNTPAQRPVSIVTADFRQLELPAGLAVGISFERLLLDLHSGRLFGVIGVFLMDLASICLLLLAFSGCWMWLRRR